ncbi:MAG: hypothetical protein MUF18_13855 [Fimbriiglobus sp.]|nr:hypothetical protein [Fimbriiglobus sp.]
MARYRDDDREDDDEDDRPRRRRDDDEDDEDDRPRKKRRRREEPKSNTGKVLLIVGLAVGIPLLLCAGVSLWGILQVGKVANQIEAGVKGEQAADSFFAALARNDVTGAYDTYTTDAFKASTTKANFEKLVKAHPILTTSNDATTGTMPTPVGTKPNRTLTLTYMVETFNPNNWDEDFDEDNPQPKPKPKPPVNPATPTPKAVTCTVVVAEQANGTWKVDKFTIP